MYLSIKGGQLERKGAIKDTGQRRDSWEGVVFMNNRCRGRWYPPPPPPGQTGEKTKLGTFTWDPTEVQPRRRLTAGRAGPTWRGRRGGLPEGWQLP